MTAYKALRHSVPMLMHGYLRNAVVWVFMTEKQNGTDSLP